MGRRQQKVGKEKAYPNSKLPVSEIHGSKFKLDPASNPGQTPVVRITHSVFLFRVSEYPLNGLFSHRVNVFSTLRFPNCFTISRYSWRTNIPVIDRVILIIPRFVPVFSSLVSGIRQDRNLSVLQCLLCDPRSFVSCVHCLSLVFLLVRAGFDMGCVYEDNAGVYHPVIQRFFRICSKISLLSSSGNRLQNA